MRFTVFITLGIALLSVHTPAGSRQPANGTNSSSGSCKMTSASGTKTVDFDKQIRPILEQRCQPCHFSGGTIYEKLPFDRPATILTLGTKLVTRIKNEDQRALIRKFLSGNGRSDR